jgi:hypothetical protein
MSSFYRQELSFLHGQPNLGASRPPAATDTHTGATPV